MPNERLTFALSLVSIFICFLFLNAYDSWVKGQNKKCQFIILYVLKHKGLFYVYYIGELDNGSRSG